jgi:hypothetical protein
MSPLPWLHHSAPLHPAAHCASHIASGPQSYACSFASAATISAFFEALSCSSCVSSSFASMISICRSFFLRARSCFSLSDRALPLLSASAPTLPPPAAAAVDPAFCLPPPAAAAGATPADKSFLVSFFGFGGGAAAAASGATSAPTGPFLARLSWMGLTYLAQTLSGAVIPTMQMNVLGAIEIACPASSYLHREWCDAESNMAGQRQLVGCKAP